MCIIRQQSNDLLWIWRRSKLLFDKFFQIHFQRKVLCRQLFGPLSDFVGWNQGEFSPKSSACLDHMVSGKVSFRMNFGMQKRMRIKFALGYGDNISVVESGIRNFKSDDIRFTQFCLDQIVNDSGVTIEIRNYRFWMHLPLLAFSLAWKQMAKKIPTSAPHTLQYILIATCQSNANNAHSRRERMLHEATEATIQLRFMPNGRNACTDHRCHISSIEYRVPPPNGEWMQNVCKLRLYT